MTFERASSLDAARSGQFHATRPNGSPVNQFASPPNLPGYAPQVPWQSPPPVQGFAPGPPMPPPRANAPKKPWWSILLMMVSPGQVIAQGLGKIPWPFALGVSGVAFAIFFFQTGLDRHHVGPVGWIHCFLLALLGGVYGTAGIAGIAAVAWSISRLIGGEQTPEWVIRAVALSYSSALVYGIVGLVFNLFFKWNTSISFGVTGVLWALGPMMTVFRQLTNGKLVHSVALATFCGALVLLGWGLLAT